MLQGKQAIRRRQLVEVIKWNCALRIRKKVTMAGVMGESSIESGILSSMKQITSPGWMHETSAQAWCTGKTQREDQRVEREVGGGIRTWNTCKSMADSCQCMAKNHYTIVK